MIKIVGVQLQSCALDLKIDSQKLVSIRFSIIKIVGVHTCYKCGLSVYSYIVPRFFLLHPQLASASAVYRLLEYQSTNSRHTGLNASMHTQTACLYLLCTLKVMGTHPQNCTHLRSST